MLGRKMDTAEKNRSWKEGKILVSCLLVQAEKQISSLRSLSTLPSLATAARAASHGSTGRAGPGWTDSTSQQLRISSCTHSYSMHQSNVCGSMPC